MPSLTPSATVQRWDAYRTAWNLMFQKNLAEIPTFYERFATVVPSSTLKEAYIWMDRLPQMREWLGERLFNNPAVRYQEIENKLYELSVNVRRTEIEDDRLGVYDQIIPEIARAARVWPDVLCAAALQAGATTTGFDSQYIFDDDHPVDPDNSSAIIPGTAYTTQVNKFTGSASGMQPGALPLSAPNLATAYQTMASYIGPDGLPMNVVPDLVIVPPQLKFTAKAILEPASELIGAQVVLTGPTYGAAAVSNYMRGALEYMVLPYLANAPTTWYLACTTRATKPIIFQSRESPEQVFFTRPTDTDVFMHDTLKYGVRARGNAGFSQWFLIAQALAS